VRTRADAACTRCALAPQGYPHQTVHHPQVEEAKAGDKAVFTGNLVVVPDVGALSLPNTVAVKSGGSAVRPCWG
jgi:hypothetical protein